MGEELSPLGWEGQRQCAKACNLAGGKSLSRLLNGIVQLLMVYVFPAYAGMDREASLYKAFGVFATPWVMQGRKAPEITCLLCCHPSWQVWRP